MAKIDRAIELTGNLQKELGALSATPSPYFYENTVDPLGGHYVFRQHPGWEAGTASRWAVMIGEIVHDLRSSLDHLAWHAVELSGTDPDEGHAFPLLSVEPEAGFTAWATRAPNRRGTRHGKLFGASAEAIALVEYYQPYRGGQTGNVLAQLDCLWQRDKHRMALPIALVAAPPALELAGCELIERRERMEDGVLIVEVDVVPRSQTPKVELRAEAPLDIGYEGRPVIDDLLRAAQIVVEMKYHFEELFPDEEDLRHGEARVALERLIGSSAAE